MTYRLVENTLAAELATASLGYPIAWPNQDFDESAKPYLAVQMIQAGNVRLGPAQGGTHEYSGIFQITVVTDRGRASGEANGIADQIAAVFVSGTRFTFSGGYVDIMKDAEVVGPGFAEGSGWRLPVSIAYRARF